MEKFEKSELVSIVIRSKNEEKFIGKVLEKIFSQKIDFSFEVIVIDSGSKDKTLEIGKKFPIRIYQIPARKFTFGYALNYGVKLSNGEYIVFLSAHAIPENDKWLKSLIVPLVKNENVLATYGKQKPVLGLNPLEEMELLAWFSDKNPKCIFSNANCAIKKEILYKFPFDENILSSEDRLWALKLPAEFKIEYVPSASVFHSHHLSWKYWMKRFYIDGWSKQYMKRKINLANKRFKILDYPFYCYNLSIYLLKHKYFYHLLFSYPLYIFIKPICYISGVFSYKFLRK